MHFLIVYVDNKEVKLFVEKGGNFKKIAYKGVTYMKNKAIKAFMSFFATIIFILLAATFNVMSMPGDISLSENKDKQVSLESCSLKSNLLYKINAKDKQKELKQSKNSMDLSVKLFGLLPVKTVTVNFVPEVKVTPGGQPIGVKLYTEGVLVVGFSDIETKTGKKQSPAISAGIELGDSIIEINGIRINSNAQVSKIINDNDHPNLSLKVNHNGEIKNVTLKAVETGNHNEYKIGLWIRDYTAGVGTLTFYDNDNKKFGALGHPINDIDTGSLLTVREGKIYNAKIVAIEQGVKGKPGELKGIFSEEDVAGILKKNTSSGIFGDTASLGNLDNRNLQHNKPIPIARQSEIREGTAQILTSIEDGEVKAYDIYIEKLTKQSKPNSKSMIIRITDKELLAKTGGIVQGMSGSPIIQDGKLVGAVTHVFVNRPNMGYGIYIEWMLKEIGVKI